jgi:hypothetical protein
LLTSKDELKIRLQANNMAEIWPVLDQTCKYLSKEYQITFTDRLPYKDLDFAIEQHFQCKGSLKQLKKQLDELTL